MITAVDSSVLLDVLKDDPNHRASSLAALSAASETGPLIVCPVVWAEIRSFFEDAERMQHAFSDARIQFDPFDQECADVAGHHWFEYRRRGGTRKRLVADFLIGAHAQVRGGRFLTRDRGFFRRYFSDLQILN
ncbi:MAG: type II toxin-antitoxin system VapC family toxin [Vulcanimicrobiaceae bacterium]